MPVTCFAFPRHAHMPGLNPRHDEALFDPVKATAPARTRSEEAARNLAWQHGLDLFAAGYFWEAHEVLEAVWMNAAPNSAERYVVQGVIQLANSALKSRMGREKAARRLAEIARDLFSRVPAESTVMGLSVAALRDAAERALMTEWPQQAACLSDATSNMQYSA